MDVVQLFRIGRWDHEQEQHSNNEEEGQAMDAALLDQRKTAKGTKNIRGLGKSMRARKANERTPGDRASWSRVGLADGD